VQRLVKYATTAKLGMWQDYQRTKERWVHGRTTGEGLFNL